MTAIHVIPGDMVCLQHGHSVTTLACVRWGQTIHPEEEIGTVARALTLYETSIGKKAVMAVSGAVWLGFVFSHMAGNLLVFVGADAMNNYALSLREMGGGGLLWGARFVLLAAIAGHVWSALSLKRQNSSARPVAYKVKKDLASTPSSKTMMYGGYAILGFIIFHLLHLTLHVVGPVKGGVHNVYNNVVNSFQNPLLVLVYLVAVSALALHLYHGAWSFMQSLGFNHARYNALRKNLQQVSLAL